ncbi:limbin-like isoform X1 [Crassostrea angulata]|uniref:limbin-like isoform X1 n=1 Tax=Magallana angulata TaxID=2784310 RepID=UPI0022B0E32E|nr:limbin-like isoform X1 [Crassostrea angulata]
MWLRYLTLLSLLVVSCRSYSVTDLTEIYQTQLSNNADNYTYNYNLHTFADNTSINYASVNTSSYLHTYVERGGFVLDLTQWQDNSSGTPSNVTTLPLLKVTQRWEVNSATASPDTILVSMTISNPGSVTANNVTMTFDLTGGLRLDISSIVKNTSTVITHTQSNVKFQWYSSSILASEEMFLSFVTVPSGTNGGNLEAGHNVYTSQLYFASTVLTSVAGPIDLDMCVYGIRNVQKSIFYEQGFTALMFFIAFALGIGLVIGAVCLFLMIKRKRAVQSKSFTQTNLRISTRGKTILMDDGDVNKTGHTITDFSNIREDDSIVEVLVVKDKLKRFRELDNLDIVCTVSTDTDIETQRADASLKATAMLIRGLIFNRDISPQVYDAADKNMKQRRLLLDGNLDTEFQRQNKKLRKKLAAKNKAKLSRTLQRQREEKKKLVSEIADLGDNERKQLLDMMDQEHQTELNEEEFLLKLEQDEETENLRKEFAVRRRMGMKELQQDQLEEVMTQGHLVGEKADWLLEEHRKVQAQMEKMYDEEVARQRILLEEKLEKRKALAKLEEQQEDDGSDVLNTMASHQIELINKAKAKKVGGLTPDEASELIAKAKEDMISLKERLDKDRQKQEMALAKRLGDMKRKKLNQMKSQQKSELDKVMKSMETQTDEPIDPLLFVETKLKLEAKHREEVNQEENEIDEDHAEQLRHLNDELTDHAKDELSRAERNLVKRIGEINTVSPDQYEKLLSEHEADVMRLQAQQKRELEKQKANLNAKLAKSRRDWEQRKEQEKAEQEEIRKREDEVVKKLISGQMSMSEEERDRIMKEHEKQMVKVENSLTLNKLRQKRMLEERLAAKRALQMDKLEKKQSVEYEKKMRQIEHNGEESDPENQREKLELMKLQFSQKMAVLQGQKLNIDDELENVKIEMLKERVIALKEQEEKLGAMVAALQVAKAREMALIEEQQAAINNLKSNLIDELSERGILSDPECQKVLDRHKQEQENLNKKLESQKSKQEKELRKRLKEKIEQKEEIMSRAHKREIEALLATSKNKTALKMKQALLAHKHMMEMEKFRNNLDRQIAQTLEDVRLQFEMRRAKETQQEELRFIAGLVRVGSFDQQELIDVLHILYPQKTDTEIQAVMKEIYDPNFQQAPKDVPPLSRRDSSLTERVRSNQSQELSRRASLSSRFEDSNRGKADKKSSFKKSRRQSDLDSDSFSRPLPNIPKKKKLQKLDENSESDNEYSYLSKRPEPIGEVVEARRLEDFDETLPASGLPSKLPPLEAKAPKKGRKKKKKVLQKLAHVDSDGEV